jgi:hypothetical protein
MDSGHEHQGGEGKPTVIRGKIKDDASGGASDSRMDPSRNRARTAQSEDSRRAAYVQQRAGTSGHEARSADTGGQ